MRIFPWVAVLLCSLLSLLGCQGKYHLHPVEGTLTDAAGRPLPGLQLTWECDDPAVSVTTVSDERGHYRLGTLSADDGAPAGRYRIVATEPVGDDPDAPVPQRVHARYADFATSGLSFTVAPLANRFDIQFDAP